jgi:hypothetical protein
MRAQGSAVSRHAPISASQTTSRGSPCALSATHESLTVRRPVSSSATPWTSQGRPRNSTKSLMFGAAGSTRLPPPGAPRRALQHDRSDNFAAQLARVKCLSAEACAARLLPQLLGARHGLPIEEARQQVCRDSVEAVTVSRGSLTGMFRRRTSGGLRIRVSMAASKKTAAGEEERIEALAQSGLARAFVQQLPAGLKVGHDDFLDACAAVWTARRIALGQAGRFPTVK